MFVIVSEDLPSMIALLLFYNLYVNDTELPSCDQKLAWDFECGNIEGTEGGQQTSWGPGGGSPQRGTGRSPGEKNCE